MFSIIVAVDNNRGISLNGSIPWKCPNDLTHFKNITSNHVVIMGRKTWETLPRKPLPNRVNVVISTTYDSSDTTKPQPDIVLKSIIDTLVYFSTNKKLYKNKKLFVIGGESIYKQFLDQHLVSDVHITVINSNYNCDQFITFPELTCINSYKLCPESRYYNCHTINYEEHKFLRLMHDIITYGTLKESRTGVQTKSLFSRELRFDLSRGRIPMMTTRPVSLRYVFEELIWILRGQTDNNILNKKKIHVWDDNTTREFLDNRGLKHLPTGDIGASYGFQMKHYNDTYVNCKKKYTGGVDQLEYVIKLLKNNPDSRRIIINLWNPSQLSSMALPPCVYGYQFYVSNGKLSCKILQRSSDICLAGSHNCVGGAMFVHMLCTITDLTPGELIWSPSDIHIYVNQINSVNDQLLRVPAPFPILRVIKRPLFNNIRNFEYDHFQLLNYRPQKKIRFAMNA